MKIKKDDIVKVISGKEKGKKGKVQEMDALTGRAAIEGLNIIKRHMKRGRSKQTPMGGIIEKAGTIHVSNLALYCKKCDRGVRVGYKTDAEGLKIRICKRCGEAV
jgi:large subunit ribosomal protein L24